MSARVLRVRDVMAQLGVSRQTVHRYLASGALVGTQLPSGHWRVNEADLETLLQASLAVQIDNAVQSDVVRSDDTHACDGSDVWMLYLVTGSHVFKIGISRNPRRRLRDLQLHSPITLTLVTTVTVCCRIGARRIEEWLHERYASTRSHGEWFVLDDAQRGDLLACFANRFCALTSHAPADLSGVT